MKDLKSGTSFIAAIKASLANSEPPRRVTLRHPATGKVLFGADGQPAFVDAYSLGSAQAAVRARDFRDCGDKRANGIMTAAILTVAWNLPTFDGAVVNAPCTRDTAFELYSDPDFSFIVDQVVVGLAE